MAESPALPGRSPKFIGDNQSYPALRRAASAILQKTLPVWHGWSASQIGVIHEWSCETELKRDDPGKILPGS
jgi:hypothetical protein